MKKNVRNFSLILGVLVTLAGCSLGAANNTPSGQQSGSNQSINNTNPSGGQAVTPSPNQPGTGNQAPGLSGGQNPGGTTSQSYTATQVAQHNNPGDCWLIVDSKVLNVTSFINQHPGGPVAISRLCGQDASQAFHAQGAHSSGTASQTMASLVVGILK